MEFMTYIVLLRRNLFYRIGSWFQMVHSLIIWFSTWKKVWETLLYGLTKEKQHSKDVEANVVSVVYLIHNFKSNGTLTYQRTEEKVEMKREESLSLTLLYSLSHNWFCVISDLIYDIYYIPPLVLSSYCYVSYFRKKCFEWKKEKKTSWTKTLKDDTRSVYWRQCFQQCGS